MNPAEQRESEISALRERLSRLSEAGLHITADLDAVLQRVVDGVIPDSRKGPRQGILRDLAAA